MTLDSNTAATRRHRNLYCGALYLPRPLTDIFESTVLLPTLAFCILREQRNAVYYTTDRYFFQNSIKYDKFTTLQLIIDSIPKAINNSSRTYCKKYITIDSRKHYNRYTITICWSCQKTIRKNELHVNLQLSNDLNRPRVFPYSGIRQKFFISSTTTTDGQSMSIWL